MIMKYEMRVDLSTIVDIPPKDHRIMRYETLRPIELAFIRRVYRDAWPNGQRARWSLLEWDNFIKGSYTFMNSAGFVEYHLEPGDTAFVELLAVDHSYQRQGHGTALMQHVIRRAKLDDLRRVALVTTPEVVPFYTRMGFDIYRELPDEPVAA